MWNLDKLLFSLLDSPPYVFLHLNQLFLDTHAHIHTSSMAWYKKKSATHTLLWHFLMSHLLISQHWPENTNGFAFTVKAVVLRVFQVQLHFHKCYTWEDTALYFILNTKTNIREKLLGTTDDITLVISALSITHLSLPPLFLWFEHVVSLVSMLITHLTHTLLVFMAKQVQGTVVLRAGSRLHSGKLRVHAALTQHCIW